jgi:UDP-2,3-diacylglucosamine hydrolase
VVKVAKPRQDVRFDVPVVGPGTVAAMGEAQARVLAVQAGATLLLDRAEVLAQADRGDVAVWGFEAPVSR